MELFAYAVALLLAYAVWRWRGGRPQRQPRLPEIGINRDLTPIDPVSIRGAKEQRRL